MSYCYSMLIIAGILHNSKYLHEGPFEICIELGTSKCISKQLAGNSSLKVLCRK